MARSFTRMIRGRPSQVRQMVWIGINTTPVSIGSAGGQFLSSLNAAALALRPFTVIRTRARISLVSDQTAATELARGAYGRMVVSDQASGVGATAIPFPVNNSDAPWFVWEPILHNFVVNTAVGFESPGGTITEIDSKAMRKVGNNEDLVSMFELVSANGCIISVVGRTLVKLH